MAYLAGNYHYALSMLTNRICHQQIPSIYVGEENESKKLAASGCHFHYSLEEAITDWFEDNGRVGLEQQGYPFIFSMNGQTIEPWLEAAALLHINGKSSCVCTSVNIIKE